MCERQKYALTSLFLLAYFTVQILHATPSTASSDNWWTTKWTHNLRAGMPSAVIHCIRRKNHLVVTHANVSKGQLYSHRKQGHKSGTAAVRWWIRIPCEPFVPTLWRSHHWILQLNTPGIGWPLESNVTLTWLRHIIKPFKYFPGKHVGRKNNLNMCQPIHLHRPPIY